MWRHTMHCRLFGTTWPGGCNSSEKMSRGWPGGSKCPYRLYLPGNSAISSGEAASAPGELLHWDELDEETAQNLGVELIEGRTSSKSDSHPTEEALCTDKPRISRRRKDLSTLRKPYITDAGHPGRELLLRVLRAPTRPMSSRTLRTDTYRRGYRPGTLQGALCLYIRPTEEGVSYYRDTWSYGQLVYQKTPSRKWRHSAH